MQAYLPSTSGIETTVIKEELFQDPDEINFETELDQNNDRMDFEVILIKHILIYRTTLTIQTKLDIDSLRSFKMLIKHAI